MNLPLVKRDTLAPLTLLNDLERIGAHLLHPGPKREKAVGVDGLPFIHHYSWVRTKEECLQKGRTWGHKNEENWTEIVEKTFRGEGLFHIDLEFEEIPNPLFLALDVKIPSMPLPPSSFSNVLRINDRDLFRKGLELL